MNKTISSSTSNTASQETPGVGLGAERHLLSKAQVAARLGCSERSLERLVKQGRFPTPRRYGRAVVWFESAVEHVLALEEEQQLQWRPVASDVRCPPSTLPSVEPPVASLIPPAHELEPEPQSAKPRTKRRRVPPGVNAAELQALGQAMQSGAQR